MPFLISSTLQAYKCSIKLPLIKSRQEANADIVSNSSN